MQQPVRTISVVPTHAGDGKYFVVTEEADGSKLLDSLRYQDLTDEQKRMAHTLDRPGMKRIAA